MASSDKQRFSKLITGDNLFKIPKYQRNYSWEKEQREDLWDDLIEAIEMDRDHYIGAFLLNKDEEDGEKVQKVIDGQQRMTTLLILLFELQRQFEKKGDETTSKKITGQYITDYGSQKLELLGNDKVFFKNIILEGVMYDHKNNRKEDAMSKANFDSSSQRRLYETKEFFREKLSQGPPESIDVEDELDFYKKLFETVKELPLLSYAVESKSEAARIFQTVNDRGKRLTDLEITKSYLMHRISLISDENAEQEIERIEEDFREIYNSIEDVSEKIDEDSVQRYHFIMWNPDWTTGRDKRYYQDHLDHLKTYFRRTDSPEEILRYTNELQTIFDRLKDITNPEKIDDEEIRTRLEKLSVAGRLANFYPLIITAYDQYKNGQISREKLCLLFERIEAFIVRTYIIQKKSADTGRTRAYPLARQLYYNQKRNVPDNIEPKDIEGVVEKLDQYIGKYCDNDDIDQVLQNQDVYEYYAGSNRLDELRFLLYTYETSLEHEKEDIPFDAERIKTNKDDRFSVEHIWPQTPSEDMEEEKKEVIEENTHRLGNLALMTPEDNSSNQNDTFEEKKDNFAGSKFRMLEKVFKNDQWSKEKIRNREEDMINRIKDRWPEKA
ncbi:MAG: DUF262 domain-containing protein [Candidatus Nanohaloarchaea archaeon]